MTKYALFTVILSLALFSSCSKTELDQEVIEINAEFENATPQAKVDFIIDNQNNQVFEKDPLLLINTSENAVSYLWDFGNGDTSTEANPDYSYDNHGVYSIKLTVTDRNNKTIELSKEVVVICLFEGQIHTSGN